MSLDSHKSNSKKVIYAVRNFSKSVNELIPHIIALCLSFYARNSLVYLKFLLFVQDIAVGNICADIKVDNGVDVFSCIFFTRILLVTDCFFEHLAIKVITYSSHITMLFNAEEISSTSNLKISHCDFKSGTKVCKFFDGSQTFFCHFLKHLISLIHKESVSCTIASTYTSSKLVQLGESHIVSIVYDDCIYI